MATPGSEVELLQGGVETRALDRGNWSQNVWRPDGTSDLNVRSGFGQIAQFDTTLSNVRDVEGNLLSTLTQSGYRKHLGSLSFETEFGTTQILSVFSTRATTGEGDASNIRGKWGEYYSVTIFDVGTRTRWEEILHRHTSENKTDDVTSPTGNPSSWFGCYETNETFDRQAFVAGLDSPFYFQVFKETVFFGNKYTGLLAYFPVDIRKTRQQTVDSAESQNWVKGYSESSLVTRVVPVEGHYPAKFNYLNATDIPAVVALGTLQGSLVLATETELYFSEPHVPNSFIDRNFSIVPSSNSITAITEVGDNLLVFTESETFLYQPSVGDVMSGGLFTALSKTVGCIGPSALFSDGTTCSWVDQNGIYTIDGGLRVKEISEPINLFFRGGVTSPMAHYLTASGLSDPDANEQPRTLYRASPGEQVSVTYWRQRSALVVSFGDNNAAWVLTGGQWSIWPFESSVTSDNSVGVTRNIQQPFVMSARDSLFLCGSLDERITQNNVTEDQWVSGTSFYLMEYGVGGSIDRSIKDEDGRDIAGYWQLRSGSSFDTTRFYIGKPTYDPISSKYRIPVDLVTDSATNNPTNFFLQFYWDDSKFAFDSSGLVPTERLANEASFAPSVVVDPAGDDRFRLTMSPAVTMNTATSQRNPLYVLTGDASPSGGQSFWGYGMNTITANVTAPSGVTTDAAVYVWQQFYGDKLEDSDIAQPVDWAYKGQQVEDQGNQLQARGIFSTMISHGSATSRLFPSWMWGVYNTLLGSDWKDWSSQVVDHSNGNIESQADKLTVRSRFQDSLGAMQLRKFDDAPKYGEMLVDDEEMNTIATSDSTRGQRISYMLFGFIQNKAESLRLRGVSMVLRPRKGSRRRRGR